MQTALRKHLGLVVQYIFIMLVLWVVDIATPYISGLYIDYLVSGIESNLFVVFVIIIAATNLLQMLFRYLQSIISTKLGNKMSYQISDDVFQKIFCSEYQNYANIDSAYYIDQINKDSYTLVRFFTSNIVNFFLQIATLIMSALIVFHADKLLSIIILSLIPFYILTFALNKKKMYDAKADAKQKSNEYFSRYSEQINKLPYIKRNVLNDEMHIRLQDSFDKMLHASLHSVSVDYIFMNLNQFVIIIAYLCIVGIGGYKVSTGELSIGYFSIINTYFNMIIRSVSYFLGLAGTFQDTKVSFQRIKKIMDTPEETNGNQMMSSVESVSVKNLSICYGNQFILKNCNCEFTKGNLYGIRGQNGGGKTTLLNAIMGIFSGEHSGEVYYNGIKIENLDMLKMRRTNISYLEQDPILMNMTVNEYLQFGLEVDEDVLCKQQQLLKLWDITYLLNKDMNENGSNFSGGEKQKLSMVRALSKDSSIILLDEPTSALDKHSISCLMGLLEDLKQNTIVIMISHDPSVLAQCDEVIDIFQIQNNRVFKA